MAQLEKKRELAIAFLEERRQRFSALYEEAVSVRDRPPSEQSVALQLGAKLEKVTTLPELQKLWDRYAAQCDAVAMARLVRSW